MTWVVVDPKYSTVDGAKVARVDVPYFPDEIDYEEKLGRTFTDSEWRQKVGIVILATAAAYESLQQLMGSQFADVPESTVRNEVVKLALERQVVVLRWMDDGASH